MAATVRFYVQKLPDHVLKESNVRTWRKAHTREMQTRSAFQSAFQPAIDMLLGGGVVKLTLNGWGKPYVCHILEN